MAGGACCSWGFLAAVAAVIHHTDSAAAERMVAAGCSFRSSAGFGFALGIDSDFSIGSGAIDRFTAGDPGLPLSS